MWLVGTPYHILVARMILPLDVYVLALSSLLECRQDLWITSNQLNSVNGIGCIWLCICITLHKIITHLFQRLPLAGFEETTYHFVSSMSYGERHKARRWGCNGQQENEILSQAPCKKWSFASNFVELESRSSPSQTSDKIIALTDSLTAARETWKQGNWGSCAQTPDPLKLGDNKYVLF